MKSAVHTSQSSICERPMLFSGEMVKAILAGRKSQTRRIVKDHWLSPQITMLQLLDYLGGEVGEDSEGLWTTFVRDLDRQNDDQPIYKYTGLIVQSGQCPEDGAEEVKCQYGIPGQRIWVKETHYWDRYSHFPKVKPTDFPIDGFDSRTRYHLRLQGVAVGVCLLCVFSIGFSSFWFLFFYSIRQAGGRALLSFEKGFSRFETGKSFTNESAVGGVGS